MKVSERGLERLCRSFGYWNCRRWSLRCRKLAQRRELHHGLRPLSGRGKCVRAGSTLRLCVRGSESLDRKKVRTTKLMKCRAIAAGRVLITAACAIAFVLGGLTRVDYAIGAGIASVNS